MENLAPSNVDKNIINQIIEKKNITHRKYV